MEQKICLVTGANSGIGKEIALGLAKSGAHIIMVCRNQKRGEEARHDILKKSDSTSVDLLIADLSSQQEIRKLAATIQERYKTLDVLINNAGLVLYEKSFSVDGIEMTLATNHLGPFLLTQLLLDLLKKSAPSRIINISSDVHKWANLDLNDLQYEKRAYQFMKAYAQSKLLMNITSFELARQLEGSGVTVNCVHPGAVKTNLGSAASNNFLLKFMDKAIKFFFMTPEKSAQTPIYLALSPELSEVSGKYFVKGKARRANAESYDTLLAKSVWRISEAMTGS